MKLIWIDLETTGLNPVEDCILELALIITDEKLNTLTEDSWVLGFGTHSHVYNGMNPYVRSMHTTNGLFADCEASKLVTHDVSRKVLEKINRHCPDDSFLLAGSSVHFDRKFLDVHMEHLGKRFSHHHLDVSVFHRAAELWHPGAVMERPTIPAHRALPDIRHSIAVARHYKDQIFEHVFELQRIFDAQREADQRAIKLWRAVDPEKRQDIWPDRTGIVLWLLEELTARDKKIAEQKETQKESFQIIRDLANDVLTRG